MTKLRLAVAMLALSVAAPAVAKPANAEDKAQIAAVVRDYFDGQGEGSAERLNRAFLSEDATMVGVISGEDGAEKVKSWKDMREVLAAWSKDPKPDAPKRDGEILDMHVVDGRIATVAFRSADRFYDALTLVKIEGQWKIAAKVFVLQKEAAR